MLACSCFPSSANPHAERIFWIQNELRLRIHKCRTSDTGINLPFLHSHCAFKHAADNTFLPPDLAFLDLSVGIETRQLCACTGPARRPVIRLARTKQIGRASCRERV